MDDNDADKLFPPTPRRREEARREGRVPRSGTLSSAVLSLVFLIALRFGGGSLWRSLELAGGALWSGGAWIRVDEAQPVASGRLAFASAGLAIAPWLALLAGLAVATNLAQVGFFYRPERLGEGWSHVLAGPSSGRGERWKTTFWGFLQMAAVILVVAWRLAPRYRVWGALPELPLPAAAAALAAEALDAGIYACGALVALGTIDYAWRWWQHERSLWMTFDELRAELKNEGGATKHRQVRRSVVRQNADSV